MRQWLLLLWLLSAPAVQAQDAVRLGVFGTVEQMNPLVVAGVSIDVPDTVPVISPLGVGQTLERGDTVAISATLNGGALKAVRLLQIYAVAGPVSSVSADTAVVMGSKVHLPPDTDLGQGRWVAVSGLWSGETVITTKLRVLRDQGFGQLTGVVDPLSLQLGASGLGNVQVPAGGFGEGVWILTGTPRDAGLQVRLMSQGLFGGAVDMALWQGHASAPVASQTYMIHGTGILGTARDAEMPAPGALVERCAVEGRALRTPPEGLEAAFVVLGCAR